jgi:hypothetical protein
VRDGNDSDRHTKVTEVQEGHGSCAWRENFAIATIAPLKTMWERLLFDFIQNVLDFI